ncbi:hypothetical protein ACFX1S_023619 [Malus domestica]|uniref:Uncharacterized protein n=1 Tax=Malus domestica TaxID=3750 RepID=A0A498HJF1_MALDO|nr:hypothetical protein DVH24_037301 [Malus domestica]
MERNNIFTIALVCLLVTGVGGQAPSSVPTNSSATPAATLPATTLAAAPKPKSPFLVATPKSSPTPASALPKSVAAPTLSKSKKPKHKSPAAAPTPDVASSPAPEGPHASSSNAVFATVSLHSLQEEGEGVPDLKDNQGQWTESPSKRGSQRTPDPALRVRRHGVSSGEHRPFRGHLRPNHDKLAGVQGINLFVSSSSTTFLFVSLNFVEYC